MKSINITTWCLSIEKKNEKKGENLCGDDDEQKSTIPCDNKDIRRMGWEMNGYAYYMQSCGFAEGQLLLSIFDLVGDDDGDRNGKYLPTGRDSPNDRIIGVSWLYSNLICQISLYCRLNLHAWR